MQIDRNRAAELGQETLRILEAGDYVSPTGRRVGIRDLVERAKSSTRSYPSGLNRSGLPSDEPAPRVEVRNQTTLAAAREQWEMGRVPAALNFASARHPGGGFLTGARAQEESLARSSGLYACLVGNPMYDRHRAGDAVYSDFVIYSPDVPVFRDDNGMLLEEPYLCTFITCPAVNAKVVLERDPKRRPEVRRRMDVRIRKVLAVAAAHEHDHLILGAWGCGAFGNDPAQIADLFKDALTGEFCDAFDHILFAISDSSADRRFIAPFERVFG